MNLSFCFLIHWYYTMRLKLRLPRLKCNMSDLFKSCVSNFSRCKHTCIWGIIFLIIKHDWKVTEVWLYHNSQPYPRIPRSNSCSTQLYIFITFLHPPPPQLILGSGWPGWIHHCTSEVNTYFMDIFMGGCNFSQSSGVRRRYLSPKPAGGGGRII